MKGIWILVFVVACSCTPIYEDDREYESKQMNLWSWLKEGFGLIGSRSGAVICTVDGRLAILCFFAALSGVTAENHRWLPADEQICKQMSDWNSVNSFEAYGIMEFDDDTGDTYMSTEYLSTTPSASPSSSKIITMLSAKKEGGYTKYTFEGPICQLEKATFGSTNDMGRPVYCFQPMVGPQKGYSYRVEIRMTYENCKKLRKISLSWGEDKHVIPVKQSPCIYGIAVDSRCLTPFFAFRNPTELRKYDSYRISKSGIMRVIQVSFRWYQQPRDNMASGGRFKTAPETFLWASLLEWKYYSNVDRWGQDRILEIIDKYGGYNCSEMSETGLERSAGRTEVDFEGKRFVHSIQFQSKVLLTFDNMSNPYVLGWEDDKKSGEVTGKFGGAFTCSVPMMVDDPLECKMSCETASAQVKCSLSADGPIEVGSEDCVVGSKGLMSASVTCHGIEDHEIRCNGKVFLIKGSDAAFAMCFDWWGGFLGGMGVFGIQLAASLCKQGVHSTITVILFFMVPFGLFITAGLMLMVKMFLESIVVLSLIIRRKRGLLTLLPESVRSLMETKIDLDCDFCGEKSLGMTEMQEHINSCTKGNCPYCYKKRPGKDHVKRCEMKAEKKKEWEDFDKELRKEVGTAMKVKYANYVVKKTVYPIWLIIVFVLLIAWGATAQITQEDIEAVSRQRSDQTKTEGIYLSDVETTAKMDLEVNSKDGEILLFMPLPLGAKLAMRRKSGRDIDGNEKTVVISTSETIECAGAELRGSWCTGERVMTSVFDCLRGCTDWLEKQLSNMGLACRTHKYFQSQTGWTCNPGWCWSINQGCHACQVGYKNVNCPLKLWRVINVRRGKKVCVSIGDTLECHIVMEGECSKGDSQVCLRESDGYLKEGMYLTGEELYRGEVTEAKGVCLTNCKLGDVGDWLRSAAKEYCPRLDNPIDRFCKAGKEPSCSYTGDSRTGLERYLSAKDAFSSWNLTNLNARGGDHCYIIRGEGKRVELAITVPASVVQKATKCSFKVDAVSIKGSWGSSRGFMIPCKVTVTGCLSTTETVQVCDEYECFGRTTIEMNAGVNEVTVKGKGGTKLSSFVCCVGEDCSKNKLKASDPDVSVENEEKQEVTDKTDVSSGNCSISCKVLKGFWFLGEFFTEGWPWILVVIIVTVIIAALGSRFFKKPEGRKVKSMLDAMRSMQEKEEYLRRLKERKIKEV